MGVPRNTSTYTAIKTLTIFCKAAIKAGSKTQGAEMLSLAKKVLSSKDVMYCPHGRPVAFEIKKYELEKQFGRIQ